MAFDLQRFYQELDSHYAAHDNHATEDFLMKSRQQAYESGVPGIVNMGCPSCVPELEPNYGFVSVCNETACFYRGLSRFKESLENFEMAQKELESFYRQNSEEYATVLLNKAGTYRYMGKLEMSLENFEKAAEIFSEAENKRPAVLAGLYNNIGLVYLDQGKPDQTETYFQKAFSLIDQESEMIVERGTTWNNEAVALMALGRQAEAEEAVKKAVEILSELDGGVNPHYPATLNTFGILLCKKREWNEALECFKEALGKTKLVYGENVEYAEGCRNCAGVLKKMNRHEEAEVYEQMAETVRKRINKE